MTGSTPVTLNVYRIGTEEPVRFAARETARYLRRMTGASVRTRPAKAYRPGAPGVWVGDASAFAGLPRMPRPRDMDARTDAVWIRAGKGHAVVTGSNARSVLSAAYRYLEALGCRWLRPGRGGERVPSRRDPLARRVDIREAASYPHRCICIEGSCAEQHVSNVIDYAAKRGYNAYMVQFFTPYVFYNRWYGAERLRGKGDTRMSVREADRMGRRAKAEALRRGMDLHTVGHGWTCEPLGIPGIEWGPFEGRIPAGVARHFAEIDGKRALFRGVPLNTNLCYSNPKVRAMMSDAVAEYAQTHPQESMLHVWLADGSNNSCECRRCRAARPSDWYVKILNEIDEKLTARQIKTRIVFLAYADLLWAPQHGRLRNPDRFLLMFAPITRSHASPLVAGDLGDEKIAPFRRNKLDRPKTAAANLAMLKQWRGAFDGECVTFDYHLIWQQAFDPGQMALARVLHTDLQGLTGLDMCGFISCQVQRISMPTGLFLDIMGRTLWNRGTPFGAAVNTYLRDLFGDKGPSVRRYLDKLSSLFDQRVMSGEERGAAETAAAAKKCHRVHQVVAAFSPTIARGCATEDPVSTAAWRLLREHADFVPQYARFWEALFEQDPAVDRIMAQIESWLQGRLRYVSHVWDTWMVRTMMRGSRAKLMPRHAP